MQLKVLQNSVRQVLLQFVTEDSRPILACFFCCAKLKQCFRFLRKCLEAEELFAQMMDEDYEVRHFYSHNLQYKIQHNVEIISVKQVDLNVESMLFINCR